MRADRLVSLVLLLRQRGRLSASGLAQELEVSTRTVLRDIEALSSAGVPVYAERGRHGGFALLPTFQTDLTALNHEEALALLIAGSRPGPQAFGLGASLASAMLKVIDALPEKHQKTAAEVGERFLVDPEADLLSRPIRTEELGETVGAEIRSAVLRGHKVRIHYQAAGQPAQWRTVDPIGLVTVRETGYLLATRDGEDRTYRLSRIVEAEELDEPSRRPAQVDLDQMWRERSERFRHSSADKVTAVIRLDPERQDELAATALTLRTEATAPSGWLRLAATFQDPRHAEWALWTLGAQAEALTPEWLRASLHDRATAITQQYGRPAAPST